MEKEVAEKRYQQEYYAKNKEKKLAKSKLYDDINKENVKQRKKRYYEKNKELVIRKLGIKHTCEVCSKEVTYITRHNRTKKHLKKKHLLENPPTALEVE